MVSLFLRFWVTSPQTQVTVSKCVESDISFVLTGRIVRVRFVRMLHSFLPSLLVAPEVLLRPSRFTPRVSLGYRLQRRVRWRAIKRAQRPHEPLPVPHNHQLHELLPEEAESQLGHSATETISHWAQEERNAGHVKKDFVIFSTLGTCFSGAKMLIVLLRWSRGRLLVLPGKTPPGSGTCWRRTSRSRSRWSGLFRWPTTSLPVKL